MIARNTQEHEVFKVKKVEFNVYEDLILLESMDGKILRREECIDWELIP